MTRSGAVTFTRSWMAGRIAAAGPRVLAVADAQSAILALRRERPDVVVLGTQPNESIRTLLELTVPRAASMTTLVVSADRSVQSGVDAMKLGADDFLVLPCSPEIFDAAVERARRVSQTRRRIAETETRPGRCSLVGGSPAMCRAREMIKQVAGNDATTILVEGETGTGKEVIAQAIHSRSARADRPFLSVNCAALPESLVESELFGHEKGAFTEARTERAGIFEAASGGTVLLDEMGDLPTSEQAKLLRFLENKTYRRVGGVEERTADVRVIAATHRNLQGLVAQGLFRPDLFFRLNVVRIHLPPLRERREDIAVLAACFIARFNEQLGRSVRGITHEAMELLERHPWPGNVRELRNVIERAFILYRDMEVLYPGHFPESVRHLAPGDAAASQMPVELGLPDAERWLITDAMRRANGNQVRAARLLGITRPTLRYRLRKHGLGGERWDEACAVPAPA